VLHERPRYFGISVIGIEQLLPALTLCRKVKDRFPESPIIIGGSVCSRMVEKDPTVATLFGRYFDFVCRYEGERPMDALLASDDPRHERTPNLAFLEDGEVVMTPLCDPLGMNDLPTPDFDDLPLSEYLSSELVLPLLTTRGCYWGKCAFCYHGMIYQDRYRMRDPKLVAADVETLHLRHGVRHFAFNDEAIPPKLFRLLPEVIPPHRYFFTGLYKFEKYFVPDDYRHMYEMGFRSLYIGLETASERVQRHMRKNNLQSTMLDNLRGAHDAGIWNHTFAFFGFPTETEAEADDTAQFMVRNADIIHSEGTGTFSFEHNAPIHHDPEHFGIRHILEKPGRVLELYYDYEPVSGLDAEAALAALRRFNELKKELGVYQFGRWIPREHLLVLLSHYDRDRLRKALAVVEQIQRNANLGDTFSWLSLQDELGQTRGFVVNRATRHVYETNVDAVTVLALLDGETTVAELCEGFPSLEAML
jgi:anaerobic magnesium-protoporphyrin IX monomethyl ester cyclase